MSDSIFETYEAHVLLRDCQREEFLRGKEV